MRISSLLAERWVASVFAAWRSTTSFSIACSLVVRSSEFLEVSFTFGGLFPQFAKLGHILFVMFLCFLGDSYMCVGGSVWVVARTVLGRGVLSICVDLSVDVEIGCCTISVCVDASTEVDTG